MHSVPRAATRLLTLATLLPLLCAAPAAAQSTSSSDPAIGALPELIDDMMSAPEPGKSSASATLGGTLNSGRTETLGVSLSGKVAHSTMKRHLLQFDASYTYADYRPAPNEPLFNVTNNNELLFTYIRPINERWSLLGVGQYRRDAILDLNYRLAAEAGVGFNLLATRRIFAQIGTSVALGKEDRAHTDAGSNVRDVGVLQLFTYKITPILGFEQYLKMHIDTSDTGDRSLAFSATFLSQVSKAVGLKIYYNHQYDSLHKPTDSPNQSQLGVGVAITLKAASSAGSKP
ncbi:MAG: DUF481 domain-containing protein [Vicinamibacterales bacterium]